MGQKSDHSKNIFVYSPKDFYGLVWSRTKMMIDFNIVNDNCILVQYKETKKRGNMEMTGNIFIAVFTKCCREWGRNVFTTIRIISCT